MIACPVQKGAGCYCPAISGWARTKSNQVVAKDFPLHPGLSESPHSFNGFSTGVSVPYLFSAVILARTGCYCKFNIEAQTCFCLARGGPCGNPFD
jgi:hypothetical protein